MSGETCTYIAFRFAPEIHCRQRWRGQLACGLLTLECLPMLPRALLAYAAHRIAAPPPPPGGIRYRIIEWAPRIVVDEP